MASLTATAVRGKNILLELRILLECQLSAQVLGPDKQMKC